MTSNDMPSTSFALTRTDDLVVYSLASRRTSPRTGAVHRPVLKPVNQSYTNKTVDTDKASSALSRRTRHGSLEVVTPTRSGGDWNLDECGRLIQEAAPGAQAVAYSYQPDVTWAIYRTEPSGGEKRFSAPPATSTLSSSMAAGAPSSREQGTRHAGGSAIPVVPLYI